MARYGYYLEFDGIDTTLGTHSAADLGLSAPHSNAIAAGTLSFDKQSFDRPQMLVKLGGFSCGIQRNPTTEALFVSKGGTETTLGTKVDHNDTTIVLGSGANTYADASQVYIGRETITLGVGTAGSYPFSSRGAKGSNASEHGAGTIISNRPRFWRGRRAVLYRVDLDTLDTNAAAAGYLNKDIRYATGGTYQLGFQGVIHKLNKQLLSGFREVKVVSNPTMDAVLISGLGTYDAFTFEVEDARQIATSSTHGVGFVMVNAGSLWGVYRVRDGEINTSTNEVTLVPEDLVMGNLYLSFPSLRDKEISIKQVQYLRDKLSRIAVQILLSGRGDQTNHASWDVLPGRTPDFSSAEDLTRKRVGAWLPPSWVDIASFGQMNDIEISVLIDEPVKAFDFLKNEILWRSGGVLYATPAGAIAFKRSTGFSVRSSLTEIDAYADGINPFEIHEAESRLISRAMLQCNYIPGIGFDASMPITWASTEEEASDNSPEVEVECKSLWVGPPRDEIPIQPAPFLALAYNFDRLRARALYGGRLVKFRSRPAQAESFAILDTISLTNAACPDLRGGTLDEVAFEIVSRKFNPKTGQAELEGEEMQRNWLLAPSFEVQSWDGGALEVTAATAGVLGNGTMFDSDPASDFASSWDAYVYHKATDFSTRESVTIRSVVSGTVLELTGAPTTTPLGGDLIVLQISNDTGDLNASESADVLDHAACPDSDNLIGAGTGYEEPGPRLA